MTSRPVRSLPESKWTVSSLRMIPSRSYHQDASGLPMISLMLSSSKSDSIGRRNGRINSKLIVEASDRWKPSDTAGLPRVDKEGLSGGYLSRDVVVFLLFRGGR